MSDEKAAKAEFVIREESLAALIEAEREVRSAQHAFDEAQRTAVSAAEHLQEWVAQWDRCVEQVRKAYPFDLAGKSLTFTGLDYKLDEAKDLIEVYCKRIRANHAKIAALSPPSSPLGVSGLGLPAHDPNLTGGHASIEQQADRAYCKACLCDLLIDGHCPVCDHLYKFWEGGKCPVDPEEFVDTLERAGGGMGGPAGDIDWEHSDNHDHPSDVIYYRLQSEKPRYDCDGLLIKDEALTIPEGFTRWSGGKCPLKEGDEFAVLQRDGSIVNRDRYCTPYLNYNWEHIGNPTDIIAYRVLQTRSEASGNEVASDGVCVQSVTVTEPSQSAPVEWPVKFEAAPKVYSQVHEEEPEKV